MKNDRQLDHAIHCPNCGTPIAGTFCHGCGQAAQLHVPSAREFLHEFIAHGKRARHIAPLRLYLTFSIIFFALFKLGGVSFGDGKPDTPPVRREASVAQKAGTAKDATGAPERRAREQARQERHRDPEKNEDQGLIEFGKGDDEKAKQLAASVHPALGTKVEHFLQLPKKERNAAVLRALSSYAPYAIFALMPVFAALLKLLYLGSGRRYGEHLLFALHTNAFAFLVLSLLVLLPDVVPLVGFGLGVWLVCYLPTAMRTVYGGARLLTALRWIVLGTLHFFCIGVAITGAAALAVLA